MYTGYGDCRPATGNLFATATVESGMPGGMTAPAESRGSGVLVGLGVAAGLGEVPKFGTFATSRIAPVATTATRTTASAGRVRWVMAVGNLHGSMSRSCRVV